MMRIALLLFLAACGSKTAPPPPVSNEGTGDTGRVAFLPEGDYLCWGGFHEYLCTIHVEDGERVLKKVGGTDRYFGSITPSDDGGFRLVGQRDDGAALDLTYAPQSDGSWRATVPSNGYTDYYTIRYMGELGSVFGSETYGGGYDEEEEED